MKRTREAIHYSHPDNREGLSGCTGFDGEDQSEEQRKKQMQKDQREYLMQQMEEKKQKQALEKQQEKMYDEQRLHFNNLVNKATEEYQQRMRDMTQANMQKNMTLHSYKQDSDQKNKSDSHDQDRRELAQTNSTQLRYTASKSYADRFSQ